MLPGCNDAEMGPANSLDAWAPYNEKNERFDLINYYILHQTSVLNITAEYHCNSNIKHVVDGNILQPILLRN